MKRQDELNEAWCKYRGKCSTEIIHALAFALKWCDQHPNWISVEDELPPYGQQVLAYSEHNPWAEMWWSERYKEYVAKFGKSGEYLILLDRNGFATLRDDGNEPIQVTHWIRIEPPAKLSSLERNGKKRKEESNDNGTDYQRVQQTRVGN